ncbi:hypothetical protein HXX76_015443 [Chlamydomonas incerta]|uniref:PAS domain-containing protein n=1 Tax=Chlamydomonas incerta TaxID=51695 RepID=A0A835SAE5_CHLIN|nr:hypothetical protein HXX76_015443 [Chlamydomonas incerta]|eukprot:KAG2423294.1 hypothetical protein HXX76_015443 [Chlamydomonas incerta]
MYVMVACVFLCVLGLAWLTIAMRRQEQSKWLKRAAVALHILFDIIFVCCYASFFDYFVFAANCDYLGNMEHVYFKGVMCFQMPHILHFFVALTTALIFFVVTALIIIASSDLNPVARGFLASPAVYPRLKILCAKAVFIISAACLNFTEKVQVVVSVICVGLICWWNFRKLPFYRMPINVVWCSLWFGILYTAVLLCVLVFHEPDTLEYQKQMTMNVLYGVWPVVAGGMALCAAHGWWAMRPAKKFKDLDPGTKLTKVHKFADPYEVEVLARVMREWDIDGVVEQEAARHGEVVIKAGMQTFPNHPYLLILYANFLLEVRKDGPASRTQLQLAGKHAPGMVERYQIFCTNEASKRLKDSQEGGMDLQAYIEFKRNYRAVIRVHREVLLLQADLWRVCLKPRLHVGDIDKAMDAIDSAAARALQVYKRVLERYPANGKLLHCYGKFLEDVKHDPAGAAKAYGDANRNGGSDALLSLDLSGVQGEGAGGAKPEFLTSMSMEDAVVVISADGTIMMCSQAATTMFGYPKNEMEGANVAVLMPQPFSQRHAGFIQRYTAGGEPRILDSVREVVALHMERYVFPVELCVTKLSGTGTDSIFLGVLRPVPPDVRNLRAWMSPNGVFLCGDQGFASMCGLGEGELVGRTLVSLVAPDSVSAAEELLDRGREAGMGALMSGAVAGELRLSHRFLDPVPVAATLGFAGTDQQRILVLNCRRTDGLTGTILVVDTRLRLRFASAGVSALLGYPARKLAAMRLDQLLPPPYNTLHAKWIRDPPANAPPTSCRAGAVVHLLNDASNRVPVRVRVHTHTDTSGATQHIAEIEKVPADEEMEEKRLVLTVDFKGVVRSVSRPESALFGFPAASLLNTNLCDSIDIFSEWRERNGISQLQMLMLALLDKEQEMPGSSWRVRVREPAEDAGGQQADISGGDKLLPTNGPSLTRSGSRIKGPQTAAKSACMQVEVDDEQDAGGGGTSTSGAAEQQLGVSGPRLRVVLWRRDLLAGVVELDEGLVVRRASPGAGLIVGLPASAMGKKPLSRYLDIPSDPKLTWEGLVASQGRGGHHHASANKKSALKAGTAAGGADRGVVSPVMAFVGPHPDSGTMRLLIQGVQTLGPGGRAKITLTLRPDTTFTGARANLMRVLKLDAASVAAASVADDAAVSEAATSHRHDHHHRHHHHRRGSSEEAGSADDTEERDRHRLMMKGSKSSRAVVSSAAAATAAGQAAGAEPTTAAANGHALDHLLAHPQQHPAVAGAAAEAKVSGSDTNTNSVDADARRRDSSDGEDAAGAGGDGSHRDSFAGGSDAGGHALSDNAAAAAAAGIHRRASSKSDFVAQWVRTLTHGASGALLAAGGGSRPGSSGGAAAAAVGGDGRPCSHGGLQHHGHRHGGGGHGKLLSGGLEAVPEDAVAEMLAATTQKSQTGRGLSGRSAEGAAAEEEAGGGSDDDGERGGGGRVGAKDSGLYGDEEGVGGAAGGGGDNKWEKGSESGDSSAEGSQATSGLHSMGDASSVSEFMIDTRRGKLLKALNKLVLGASLTAPLDRLRYHSYGVLLVMLLVHVVCFVLVKTALVSQHEHVYMVHRQALAMDRAQLLSSRVMMGAFCERPNITAKVSACVNTMNYTVGKIIENIGMMETFHQEIYLGITGLHQLEGAAYDTWTRPNITYRIFMDTKPKQVQSAQAGVWQLGNRFIATAREAVYYLPRLKANYRFHRTSEFLVYNGLWPLFEGYCRSLEDLMQAAYDSIQVMQTELIVLMIVEAVIIQTLCSVYQFFLVRRVEQARMLGVLAMVGLPAPVLRQMANKQVKVGDGSDDESDDDDGNRSNNGDEDRDSKPAGDTRAAAPGGGGGEKGSKVRGDGSSDEEEQVAAGGRNAVGKAAAAGREAAGGMQARFSSELPAPPAAGSGKPLTIEAGPAVTSALASVFHKGSGSGGLKLKSSPSAMAAAGARRRGQHKPKRHSGIVISGRLVIPSAANIMRFMVPFLLWNIAVIVIYALSVVMLKDMQGPLASLNMASHVIFRYTRIRSAAFGMVANDDAPTKAFWRGMLKEELPLFVSEYDSLMYGGLALSQVNDSHPIAAPASTFASSAFSASFFRTKRCFRWDPKNCLATTSPYYTVSRNGLDGMVRRVITEMTLLSLDDDRDAVYNKSRYDYIHMVGGRDCLEGLQDAAQLFVDHSIAAYDEVQKLHTILLAVTIVSAALYLVMLLWPHCARVQSDAARQAALLSHVPPETDVKSHVRSVFRRFSAAASHDHNKRRAVDVEGGSAPPGGGAALPTSYFTPRNNKVVPVKAGA